MASLSIEISENAQAFASAEAAKRGLADAAAYTASLLEETAKKNGSQPPLTAFHDMTTDLHTLIREQGVKPINDFRELVADFWPEDETADDVVAAVRQWRKGLPGPEPKA